jgi:NADP-dependent 3-hydroxy acid dehydrogenase YdfG
MYRSIVTGGTRGIGRAIAKAILAADGHVMITGRNAAAVTRVVRELGDETGGSARVAGHATDVRDRSGTDALIASTLARFGGLDVVVNNAGIAVMGAVEQMSDEDWHLMMDTNVNGPFYMTRAAIPALRRSGGGWIVNIASLAGRNAFPNGAGYCATKSALVAFSEAVMQEVRHDDIRVSVVMPGSVATGFSGRSGGDDSWKLSPDDVAQVVMDLLRHPARSLPSKVEIRPTRPQKH